MFINETPLNILRPKVKKKYTAIEYGSDIVKGILYYKHSGNEAKPGLE